MIRTHWFGLLLALVGILACESGPSARGQVLDDEVEEELNASMPGMLGVQQQFMIADSSFDQVVFGTARTSAAALARLETLVKLKIDEVDQVARLTDAQRKKLELASRGDIRRFFDQVDEKRKGFQLVRNDQQKYAAFYQQLHPLRTALSQGLFGEDSIFTKTLKKTLNDGQVVKYDDLGRRRRLLSQEARIGRVLAILDNSVGLDSSQRRKLLKLIVEETRPPKIYGTYDIYVVLFQLSRLPQERIKPIFQEAQWRLVRAQLEVAQKYEQMLTRQGVLPAGEANERWIVPVDPEASERVPKPAKQD